MTTTYNVSSEGATGSSNTDTTTLNGAIRTIDTGAAGNYIINIAGIIDLTTALLAINLPAGSTLTINGGVLSGLGSQRGLFVYSGNVTIEDLTIENMIDQGGAGAAGSDGGGGGAGLGGALFVAGGGDPGQATAPVVTLDAVIFGGNSALGGAGGDSHVSGPGSGAGGGLGGAGGAGNGGGGGIGRTANGGSSGGGGVGAGIVPGAGGGGSLGGASGGGGGGGAGGVRNFTGGGGGGIDGGSALSFTGGNGGFGGGGGSGQNVSGGKGGFGGGGGGAKSGGFGGGGGGASGAGGFGAGNGSTEGGGGGLGAGGDIFVQQGGSLTIDGGGALTGGSAFGGPGAGDLHNGAGLGSGIFLQGNGTLTFAPASAQTEAIADVITDQTGSGGTSANAGSWGLLLNGAGALTLTAADSYSGGTTIDNGSLQLGDGSSDGSITGNVTDNATFADDDSASNTVGAISGSGSFQQIGSGTTILTGADSYTGGTTVDAGILQIGTGASLASTGNLTIDNGTFDLNGNDQTIGDLSGAGGAVTLNGGALTFGTADSTTYFGGLVGPGGLTKNGSGTFTLVGNDSAIATFIVGGALQIGNGGGSGSISGDVLDEATLTIDRSGVVTLSGAISGGGSLHQIGSGTVFITANDNYSGGTTISAGALQIGNGGASGSITGGVTDNGSLIVDESGAVTLSGNITGSGSFAQIGSGTTILTAVDSVNGGTTIAAGTLKLGSGGEITGDVTFAGADATLALETGLNQIGGDIAGAVIGDAIDLGFQSFAAGDHAVWTQNGATGMLTVENAGGSALAALTLAGTYATADFKVESDSNSDALIALIAPSPPVVTTGNPNVTFNAGGPAIEPDNAVSITDAESSTLLSATVAITGGAFAGDGDVLSADTIGTAVSANYNSTTETLTLSGPDTLADYQAVLRQVSFASTAQDPTNAGANSTRTVTWTVNDGSSASAPVTTVIGVNEPPTQTTHTVNINEGGSTGTLAAGDSDLDGDRITVTGVTGGTVGAPLAGTYGTLTLNANDTFSYAANNMTAIVAAPPGNPTDSFTYTVSDGHGGSATETLNFVIQRSHVVDDFNADLTSDVLWRNIDGSLAGWLMDGSVITSSAGPTYQGIVVSPDVSWNVVGAGDFNDGGSADILWRQSTTGLLADWTMNGTTIASSGNVTSGGRAVAPDSTWSVAGVGNFNGDGDADILWRQSTSGSLAEWLMNGTTIISSAVVTSGGSAVAPDASWSVAGIGDYNGDGNADLLWRQSSTGSLVEWAMNGAAIASSAFVTSGGNAVAPDASWSVAGVGDFNGDGKADLLWRQGTTGSLAMWLMDGSAITSSASVTPAGSVVAPDSTWTIIEVGDFNGTNQAGILWQQSTTGTLVEWQMNGPQIVSSQTVTSAGTPVAPASTWQAQARPTDFV